MQRKQDVKKLTLTAMFIALGIALPFLTGQIPQIGRALSPMHIPILLCGFICGWKHGGVAGFITPLLRSVLFGMPVLFPSAVGMAFELAAYGILTGVIYARFKNKNLFAIYATLILSMIGGRIVWGLVSIVLYGIQGNAFTFQAFLAGALINAVPGIILHLALIPAILIALQKARVIPLQTAADAT